MAQRRGGGRRTRERARAQHAHWRCRQTGLAVTASACRGRGLGARMADACSLPVLQDDALRRILLLLAGDGNVRDVANFARASRLFRCLAYEEPVWEAACKGWAEMRAFSSFEPVAVRDALGLRRMSSLFQALKALQGDPIGLWRSLGPNHPTGELVCVRLVDRHIVGTVLPAELSLSAYQRRSDQSLDDLLGERGRAARTAFAMRFSEELDDAAAAAGSGRGGAYQVEPAVGGVLPEGSTCAFPLMPRVSVHCNAVDGVCGVRVQSGMGASQLEVVMVVSEVRKTAAALRLLQSLLSSEQHDVPARITNVYERISSGFCGRLAPSTAPERALHAAETPLEDLAGLYTAPYGPHGLEIIQLRPVLSADAAPAPWPPEKCPVGIEIPRLEGLKITGDPNVPAGKHSFVAAVTQLAEPRADDDRHIVSFQRDGPILVRLEDRPTQMRFRCWGQINCVPALWAPQWVEAELLVYQPGTVSMGSAPVTFSVLWTDAAESFRHIIDFTPLVPGLRDVLRWPLGR